MGYIVMGRTEWLEERKKGIGGSDAAAILGLNPFVTNVELWEIKTGRKEQEDISEKECVKFGVAAEDHIRKMFALDYPEFTVSNQEFKTYTNPEYPFIKGSFDGNLLHIPTSKEGVFEAKTGTIRRYTDWVKWGGKNFTEMRIPQNYYCQILHYFLVRKDFEYAVLKARLKEVAVSQDGIFNEQKVHIRHYFIERFKCEADLQRLLTAEIKFWEYVEHDIRPPLILRGI